MRTIKFRAWDKEKKEFYYFDFTNIGSCIDSDGYFFRGEVTEWTGLTDKNGKEIYEGDIVEYEPLSTYGAPYGKQRNEVKFENGAFELVPYEDKRWGGYQNLEVIGNIWETSELIK